MSFIKHKTLADLEFSFSTRGFEDHLSWYNKNHVNLRQNIRDAVRSREIHYTSTYTLPVAIGLGTSTSNNPVTLPYQKQQFNKEINNIKCYRGTVNKEVDVLLKFNIVDLRRHMLMTKEAEDPDFYFDGNYDWYYGNALQFLDDERSVLAHSTGVNLEKVEITQFSTRKQLQQIEFDSNIYEIMKSGDNSIFAVREKNTISCLNGNFEDGGYRKGQLIESPIPYVSGIFMKDSPKFCSLDVEFGFELWDWNRPNKAIHFQNLDDGKQKPDRWGNLMAYDTNVLFHIDRTTLRMMDLRVPDGLVTNTEFDHHYLYSCESASAIIKSKSDCRFHIGTTHNVFSYDIRALPLKTPEIQWAHGFPLMPSVLCSSLDAMGDEFIVAASQVMNNVGIMGMHFNKQESKTAPTLVKPLKTIITSYELARKQGECISPLTSFHSRFTLCRTGMEMFGNGSEFTLLTHNAAGDVFQQILHLDDVDTKGNLEEVAQKMGQFMQDCLDVSADVVPKKFAVTRISDLNHMNWAINCRNLRKPTVEELEADPVREPRRGKWQRSIAQLRQYKDALAAGILDVWDMDAELDSKLNMADTIIDEMPEEDVPSKITSWFEKTKDEYFTMEPNFEEVVEEGENSKSLIEKSVETMKMDVDESDIPLVTNSKKSKKQAITRRLNATAGF